MMSWMSTLLDATQQDSYWSTIHYCDYYHASCGLAITLLNYHAVLELCLSPVSLAPSAGVQPSTSDYRHACSPRTFISHLLVSVSVLVAVSVYSPRSGTCAMTQESCLRPPSAHATLAPVTLQPTMGGL